jgi:hypothetical protein
VTLIAESFQPACFPCESSIADKNSWLILIRRSSLSLLRSLANEPLCVLSNLFLAISHTLYCRSSPNAVQHLGPRASLMLSIKTTSKEIGREGPHFSAFMAEFFLLVNHSLFALVTCYPIYCRFLSGMYAAYTNAVAAADRVQVLSHPPSSG